jgi:hypothetical protein
VADLDAEADVDARANANSRTHGDADDGAHGDPCHGCGSPG